MSAAFILSALFAAQAITSTPGPEIVVNEQKDVAFEELSQGQADKAVVSLEASLQQDPQDPATLINLGTAYAQLGDSTRAAQSFRAAATSGTRYQLELADGSWADSRVTARRALASLGGAPALAALSD